MHGVLLGATKTLDVYMVFTHKQQKDFFVGKELKSISKRLMSIKPPDYLERLLRDLEKHYANFKATEY